MKDPVIEWYENVDLLEYGSALYKLTPKMLVDEFEEVYNLFESGQINQERVGQLYDVVKDVLLLRLKTSEEQ